MSNYRLLSGYIKYILCVFSERTYAVAVFQRLRRHGLTAWGSIVVINSTAIGNANEVCWRSAQAKNDYPKFGKKCINLYHSFVNAVGVSKLTCLLFVTWKGRHVRRHIKFHHENGLVFGKIHHSTNEVL